VAVIGAAGMAYSVGHVSAQSAAMTGAASASSPIVVAQGVAVRALALGPRAASAEANGAAAGGEEEATQRPAIYLTTTQMPNRVMSIAVAAPEVTSGTNTVQAQAATSAVASAANLVAVAGNGTAGSLGDGGAATAAQLNVKLDSPYMRSGIAVAPDGTIFIADTKNSTIRRISPSSASDAGVIRSVAGKWGPASDVKLFEPMGLALDRGGNLYIADHGANAMVELHDATSAAPGKLEVLAHVAHAAAVALTPDGTRIFVASPETETVFSVDAQTRAIAQVFVGGKTSLQAGAQQASVASGTASPVCMSIDKGDQPCPWGIAVDGGGNLFVSDPTDNAIRSIDAATQEVTTAVDQAVSAPGEITFDSDGNLFVAEQGRNRISEIKRLGQPVQNVTLTPPPAPVPPAGVPCPTIAPPPGFAANTNFCAEPLSGTTPTSAWTLTNNTNSALTSVVISTVGLAPSDFVVQSTSCTSTLPANSSCLINLAFAPTATGPRTATLTVTYSTAPNPLASAVAGTGDDYYLALASGQLKQISVNAGATGTFNMQVMPVNIFTGTITFICPGNLPMETTCTFSPTSVTISTPGMAVPFSVAFQTTSRVPVKGQGNGVAAPMMRHSGPGGIGGAAAEALIVVAIALVFLVLALRARRAHPRLIQAACMIAVAVGVAAILQGCHNSSSSGVTGTPAGAYQMTVQATSQSAPRGLTITLDVE